MRRKLPLSDHLTASSTRAATHNGDITQQRESWLNKVRIEWYQIMRPLGSWVPWDLRETVVLEETEVEDYFTPAPMLKSRHVENCRVVEDRLALLSRCLPTKSICCEVGTDRGDFARQILQRTEPKELHLIDITLRNLQTKFLEASLADGVIQLHEDDSVRALIRFPDRYFDWIYIDGNHSYEGVKRDISVAKYKVKPDGLLVFNDYTFWSHRELMAYGVMQAVNEFCLEESWEIITLALSPEAVNDVVLRKIRR